MDISEHVGVLLHWSTDVAFLCVWMIGFDVFWLTVVETFVLPKII